MDGGDRPERPGHILARPAAGALVPAAGERFDALVEAPGVRLERIVSSPGHAMAADEWLVGERDEWVLLLQGRGALVFAGHDGETVLNPGDHLHLPAGLRHRVAWTDAHQPTVWLALHYDAAGA